MKVFQILIVEDNPDQRELLNVAFRRYRKAKFEPDFAGSGAECLKKCEQREYDAIILDYKLPDRSGLEVMAQLKDRGVDAPVLIVTGQGDEKVAVEAMKNGAADYVVKEHNYLRSFPQVVESIIERHRLHQRLREQEEFIQNIVEKANDFIFSLDAELRFQFVNPQVRRLGFSPEEIQGLPLQELLASSISEEDLRALTEDPDGRNFVFDFRSKDGQVHNMIVSFRRISEKGNQPHAILGIAKDVTEILKLHRLIQESKKKLQTVFDSITDYIMVLDRDKTIQMANRKVATLMNTTPDRVIGRKCYEAYMAGRVCENCAAERTWQTKRQELVEISHGGRVYQIRTFPMFNLEGEMEFVIEYARDVTEQKNIERKLIQSEKLATIGLLASGVAHELRNPLNIIETARYYIEDLLRGKDEDIQAKLNIIKRNVQRASNIINNLLEFSRHSTKDREKIDVNVIIDKTLSLIEKDLQSQNIQVEKHYSDIPPVYLGLDSLKQVFLNIIINAVQAMPEGGTLSIRTGVKGDKWIEVKFTDTGHGIPREHLKDIFTPFFTTKELGKGTGLGMYVSHSIIRREGGEILVESEVGKGTTFTVLLPRDGEHGN